MTRFSSKANSDNALHTQYHIGFEAPLGLVDHKPVHENIGIAALIQSKLHFPESTTYENLNLKQWEYFRGLVWNDDPQCLLFNDETDTNHSMGLGIEWFEEYENGSFKKMTRRSHFGNLQILHAMATQNDEPAQVTKDGLMTWLEVMYKLACGNQGVSAEDQLGNVFKSQYFDSSTEPTNESSLKDLLLGSTPSFQFTRVDLRALGVCMHIISDSYAIGHTQRRILNPQDLDSRDKDNYIRFKAGTYGRFGDVIAFHNYSGQDDTRHTHYDQLNSPMPVPKNLDTFNPIIGARDAIEKATKLVNFWVDKTAWDDGVRQYLANEVFKLDPDVTPGDNNVDTGIASLENLNLKRYPQYQEDSTKEAALESLNQLEKGQLFSTAYSDRDQSRTTSTSHVGRFENMFLVILTILTLLNFGFAAIFSAMLFRRLTKLILS